MKSILVATDFSTAASNAVDYAANMAMAINADLFILHVYPIPVIYSEVPIAINEEDLRWDAEKAIHELKDRLTEKTAGKLKITTEIRMGIFFQELKAVCDQIKPYTVVMGSQGTSASDRLLFGSHTVHTMKYLRWPLISVPLGAAFSTVKNIGFACDFGQVADTTPVDEIKMLVNDFHAKLHVLNTGKKEVFNPDIVFGSGQLQEMLAALHPEYHYITHEDTDEGIMDFAEKNHIDLLTVLPKRHGLLDQMIHKSHTKNLVLHCHVPVMALHQ